MYCKMISWFIFPWFSAIKCLSRSLWRYNVWIYVGDLVQNIKFPAKWNVLWPHGHPECPPVLLPPCIKLQYFQSPGEAGRGPGQSVRRQMVDKGQVTDDIEVTISSAEVTSSEHCEAPTQGTSTGHRVTPHGMAQIIHWFANLEFNSPFLITLYIISKI